MSTNPVSWTSAADPDGVRHELAGEITEAADFSPLLAEPTRRVVLDLEGIKRINSAGVRQWILFMANLTKSGAHVVLERCSVPFVHQLNMVTTFRGGAEIRSVAVPYSCAPCGLEATGIVSPTPDAPITVPVKPCPECGKAMEFDDLPGVYFAFHKASGTGGSSRPSA
jgi:hypothetical protein